MKVLWFSLSPCSSAKRHGQEKIIQGWMIALENALKMEQDIQLEIAYISSVNEPEFYFENVKYYPIYLRASNIVDKWKNVYGSNKVKDERILSLLSEIIVKSHPDIIHVHGTESYFSLITRNVTSIPIVYSLQGIVGPICDKYFSGFSQHDIEKTESFKNKFFHKSIRDEYQGYQHASYREQLCLCKAEYVIGRTKWDHMISSLFNSNVHYFNVDEILRTPFYRQDFWNKKEYGSFIRIVSTLSPGIYKGFETLLKSAFLLKKFANFKFEWCVIGCDANSSMVKLAERLTQQSCEDCNVKLMGKLAADDVAKTLLISDIYCHTSHIENSPNSVCESMILGVPTIASFVGGTESILEHNVEGLLYPDGDSFALASNIIQLQSNFLLASHFGINAREKALMRHNQNRVKRQLIDVYKYILNHENG